MSNTLLETWDTPHGMPPFDKIEDGHFMQAFLIALAERGTKINAIIETDAPPTFENTVVPFELADHLLTKVISTLGVLTANRTTDKLQEIDKAIGKRHDIADNALYQNEKLFARFDAIYQQRHTLPEAEQRLIEKHYREFIDTGVHLPPALKKELGDLTVEIGTLTKEFSNNVMAEESDEAFSLPLIDAEDRIGLPEDFEDKVTLGGSSREQFLTYSARRDLREKVYKAIRSRGQRGNEYDNTTRLEKITALRQRRAEILGFSTHADFRLKDRLLNTPKAVSDLLTTFWQATRPALLREQKIVEEVARAEGFTEKLEAWDWLYYTEKAKQQKCHVTDAEVREYLSLDNCVAAAHFIASKFFNLTFTPRPDIAAHHPDARVWEAKDATGNHVALLASDFYERPGTKSGGAWASEIRDYNGLTGETPIVYFSCNFAKPTADAPTLLTAEEFIGHLMHEFGHKWNAAMSKARYPSQAGMRSVLDAVEIHSQLNEMMGLLPEALTRFARHYKTGEPMPAELQDKVRNAKNFGEAYRMAEYLGSAFQDLLLHSQPAGTNKSIAAIEAETQALLDMPSFVNVRHNLTAFDHLMLYEYDVGYYSYLPAQIMAANILEALKKSGDVFDPKHVPAMRALYADGDSRPAMDLVGAICADPLNIAPLLKQLGLVSEEGTTNPFKPTGQNGLSRVSSGYEP